MHLGKVAFAAVLGLSLAARADDSVMLDLSVLDGLGGSYTEPVAPLFPVLPKKSVAAPKPQAKPRVKISKSKIAKPAQAKVKPAVLVEVKNDTPQEIVEVVDVEPVDVVSVEPVENNEVIAAAPVKEVISEPALEVNKTAPIDSTPKESQTVAEELNVTVVREDNEVVTDTPNNDDQNTDLAVDKQDIQPTEENSSLLVEDTSVAASNTSNLLTFDEDKSDLTAEHMAQIDSIVAGFANEPTNKVAIYSYNQDDGVDSFRRKRTSLNRAVEVRSYLIKKGYKNFSIKVINIGSDSDKINTIEIEEI